MYDELSNISSPHFSLTAVNSNFYNSLDILNIITLDLSFSTFEAESDTQMLVDSFSCFHCQILGNSSLLIETHLEINFGNFSSSLVVQQAADVPLITGHVLLANSFDLFCDIIFEDLTVAGYQSSSTCSGAVTCHSVVLVRNIVTILNVSFIFNDTLTLHDSHFRYNPFFVVLDYQIITGFGSFVSNTSNFGTIQPSSNFTFDDNLTLSPSSVVSLQINADSSSTHLYVGSSAFFRWAISNRF
ncbi:hypothetical protein GEMRC1_008569 [Eukaryota sp. GEM-RC1]